ncbi:MAG: SDR family NAD(P)-dependent oxidoreductase [Rikenellaceae bacterium]|jgi:NADP-dependent 3-hydroxy acid dehydrogenase YdfG|nr:SDR family NAD(P)-dependent oxidoreductase [Rikenellaceae bacterium]
MAMNAIVTGATSGIGEATAIALAEKGYNLIITGRRVDRLRRLKRTLEEEYDIQVEALCFDVRDQHQCAANLEHLPDGFERIDLLVNNAGLAAGLEHIDQGDLNDWDAMIDTNVKGVLYVTRIISRKMIAAGGGHIVNIGSIAGTETYENGAVYCASKHAMHALSQGMHIDFLRHGIRVTEIRPGMVETEFSLVRFHGNKDKADGVYTGLEPLTGEDIAETIIWAVSQPAHVNISEIVVMPSQQANAYYNYKKL